MKNLTKKVLIWLLPFVAIIALFIIVLIWQAGVFEDPELQMDKKASTLYIYLEKQGPYSQIIRAKKELQNALADQQIKGLVPCTIYLNNPAKVKNHDLKWRVGVTVKDTAKTLEPLKLGLIPKGNFIIAKIKAHPIIAVKKIYPALEKWVKENNYRVVGPAVEYEFPGGVVEAMFPIEKK